MVSTQSIWKICSSKWESIFTNFRDEHKEHIYLSCHHLALLHRKLGTQRILILQFYKSREPERATSNTQFKDSKDIENAKHEKFTLGTSTTRPSDPFTYTYTKRCKKKHLRPFESPLRISAGHLRHQTSGWPRNGYDDLTLLWPLWPLSSLHWLEL